MVLFANYVCIKIKEGKKMKQSYDAIILGAGLYGLYSALQLIQILDKKRGGGGDDKIIILEADPTPFRRATYINQARVHNGYHYPRSFSTAIKSAHYFKRFIADYSFCILTNFDQVYATSSKFSWTNAAQFRQFCQTAGIRCDDVAPDKYFNKGMCDGAFLTEEYTYDARILKEYFLNQLKRYHNVEIVYNRHISKIQKSSTHFSLFMEDGDYYETDFLLNATYASTNQLTAMMGFEPFRIKYELCEIILCRTNKALQNVGITVMDGPFFSIMPFGKTGLHSLTSVTFTPHTASFDTLPTFPCQSKSHGLCSPHRLANCNDCSAKPESSWAYMSNLAKKYLKEEYDFSYESSLFSMKPILKASEIDDSRPTIIRKYSSHPTYISVLSGKINTVYDLDEVLEDVFK